MISFLPVSAIVHSLPSAAFRSLVLALAVWAGLHLFRIRNVLALKCAWTFVLGAAFLMPLLLPISTRFSGATLVLPAFMHRAAPSASAPVQPQPATAEAVAAPAQPATQPALSAFPPRATHRGHFKRSPAAEAEQFSISQAQVAPPLVRSTPARASLSPFQLAMILYFTVAGLLLLRFFYGMLRAVHLLGTAEPVSGEVIAAAGRLRLRTSAAVSSPVTIGSVVVLPADYASWDSEKLRIVLAHEGSHIRQGDFYLQALAGFYAAIFWFSPLGWWLKRKLSDLAEAISDRCGLDEAASRSSYAQILFEFAAAPRPTLIGVAMARSSNLSLRIERLFNDRAFRQSFTSNRRAFVTAFLVPMVLFAAATLIRVKATAQTPQADVSTQPSSADAARPNPSPVVTPDATPAPASSSDSVPMHIQVPPVHVDVPEIHVNVQEQHIVVPAIHVNVPATHVDVPAHHDVPAQHIDVPAVHVDVPEQHIDVPAQHIDVPAQHIDVPAIHMDVPARGQDGSGGRAAYGSAGPLLAMLGKPEHALFQAAAPAAAEATFDRNLTFNGQLTLSVGTAAGNITLTRGSANQIRIHGVVRTNREGDPALVQQVAANPPITQEGNTIHIGGHDNNLRDIRIDYEIEAPADTNLSASTASGNISDSGVGNGAKLNTASGSIKATGLEGGFKAETGSGYIDIENTGAGDAKAQTGSGRIAVKGVHGGLFAQTGSGEIKAEGTPSSPWNLQTGSGRIEITTGNAPMNLDAFTGSGHIDTNQAGTMQTSSDQDHHHVHMQLNGGGPEVRVQTGSGEIRVD